MKPSIMNVLIEVSLEQEENTNGRIGCSVMPYTSEQWSVKVQRWLPLRMSHILMVASHEPERRAKGISGRKQRALTFCV